MPIIHEERLEGIHPDLVAVLRKAAEQETFMVWRGLMTEAEQQEAVADGVSKTTNVRNVTGHAVNLMPIGKDGFTQMPFGQCYDKLADAILLAAHDLTIPLDWGGWVERERDMGHYQLRWDIYPKEWSKGPYRA